jgi:hypothetical protein
LGMGSLSEPEWTHQQRQSYKQKQKSYPHVQFSNLFQLLAALKSLRKVLLLRSPIL